ncbi:hypothetical protein [Microbacterium sp.]|uniref:hypothetical protein n=1 Tax=Microbacterium sp. TaxID=51671 RepID=UPI0039E6A4EE
MNTEWFAAVALPVSVAGDAKVNATIFVSPRLTPDHDPAVLGEFDVFPKWGALVAGGVEFTLVDQNGPIATTADTTAVDPALWERAFDERTPVAANAVPQWQERDWRSFSAKDAADIAKTVHLATVVADPVNPVAPLRHPLAQGVLGLATQTGALRLPGLRHEGPDSPIYDESVLTRHLDDSLPRGARGAWTNAAPPTLAGYGSVPADQNGAAAQALRELHRVRRFYERPESQAESQRVKSPPDKAAPLPSPAPEFHERVAAAGDHPEFLRRLGLLIPVTADVARLRKSRWLAVAVSGRVPETACRSPRLRVSVLSDDSFIPQPNPDDPAIWSGGALALGESGVFDVVDVDVDGSAIKAERFLTTLPRLAIAQLNKTPADAATPAMRASGLTVTRRQQAGRALTQLARQEGYQSALQSFAAPADMPEIFTQDVTRGVRVEVWDSVTRVWRSLHRRRSTLAVNGEVVYADDENDGFIQGTTATETRGQDDSAVHVHEAMFGWDGWSLSAPRPGKRVRGQLEDAPDGGSRVVETVEDTPDEPLPGEKPPHPFVFTHRFAEGTLPRLRFGRDYSFRAWGVDLGGNVRPHRIGPRPPVELAALVTQLQSASPVLGSAAAFRARIDDVAARDVNGAVAEVVRGIHLGTIARAASATTLDGAAADDAATDDAAASTAGDLVLDQLDASALRTVATGIDLGSAAVDVIDTAKGRRAVRAAGIDLTALRTIGPRGAAALREQARANAARTTSRVVDAGVAAPARSRVEALADTFRTLVADDAQPIARSTVLTDLAATRELVGSHLAAVLGGPRPAVTPDLAAYALRTVTPPRPFLRWDPVPVPVVVPLGAYTEGESLRVVVVRSGVTQDADTLEVTTQSPAEYAAAVAATAPLYAQNAQRHVAPPKTSQNQAELHGVFDAGIDEGTADARTRMLAWALRESGTFFDQSVPHLTDPNGTPSPQPGVRLLPEPQGDDHFNPSDPAHPLKVLPPGEPGVDPALILRPGDAPAPGQYVVHDTQQLALPYLPDPLATGVSLAFTQAGAGRTIAFPYASEGITARYPGEWPDVQPFLLTLCAAQDLDAAGRLGAAIDGHRIDIGLPAGDVQTFRLASGIPKDRLDWMGVWRTLADRFTDDPAVQEAAADGLLWALTTGENVTLVHAVPRPVTAPRPTLLTIVRAPGSTLATFIGGVEVHGPSTEQLTVTMHWTDTVDDVNLDGPVERFAEAAGFTTHVQPQERIVPLWPVDQQVALPGWEGVLLHSSLHAFPDTKHHLAQYRFRAGTRFREYFAPALIAPDAANPLDDGQSVVSAEIAISVPSTVRPDAPKVHSVLPLLRWGEGEEPEQPFGRRRTRGTGVRIYLERPWFSSGDGELLAVLLTPNGDDTAGYPPQPNPAEGFPFVSQWGSDPIWTAPGVPRRPVSLIELDDALSLWGVDDRRDPGRPVAPAAPLPLPLGTATAAGAPETVPVVAVGYRPQYNEERRLWYVDIAFDPRATFWPFVRLAVARYQPASVPGAHLSTPVQLDFVQLAPERTASVSRTDDTHARVVVSGFAGHRSSASRDYARSVTAGRRVVARLQRHRPDIGGDLAWESVDAVELAIRGRASRAEELVWVGELEADGVIEVRTPPGASDPATDGSTWRVRVEEWERFEGDPPPRAEVPQYGRDPIVQERLVYADDVYL